MAFTSSTDRLGAVASQNFVATENLQWSHAAKQVNANAAVTWKWPLSADTNLPHDFTGKSVLNVLGDIYRFRSVTLLLLQ